jgi:hypothetical protein
MPLHDDAILAAVSQWLAVVASAPLEIFSLEAKMHA